MASSKPAKSSPKASKQAPDKKAVAAYVDALGKQTVVANPYVTSVATAEGGGVTFSLRVDIASASLCGRFTVECKSAGGN